MTREEIMSAYRQTCTLAGHLWAKSYAGDQAATRAYNALSMAALHMREMLGVEEGGDHD